MEKRKIEIMDTTLRDGEQTSGVSFAAEEKVSVVRLLIEELNVDRVEIASARVSEGEFASVQKIAQWANTHNHIDKIEILGFVDGNASLDNVDPWAKFSASSPAPLSKRSALLMA